MTITETRPQGKRAHEMQSVGGIAATKSPGAISTGPFEEALDLWRERRAAIDSASLEITTQQEDRMFDLVTTAERRLFAITAKTPRQVRALAEVALFDPDSVPDREQLAAIFSGLRALDSDSESPTFDAERWLKHYERLGGGWVDNGDGITLMEPQGKSEALEALTWELRTRGGLDAVCEAIQKRQAQREGSTAAWDCALRRYQEAKAKLEAHEQSQDKSEAGSPANIAHENKTDQLADEHHAAVVALFDCPSPTSSGFVTKASIFAANQMCGWSEAQTFAQIIASEALSFAA